jgi:hypothetical protein
MAQLGEKVSSTMRNSGTKQLHEFILTLEILEGNIYHKDGWRVRVLKEIYRNPSAISELAKVARRNPSEVHMFLQNRHIKNIVEEENTSDKIVQKLTPEGRKLVKAYLRKG